MVSRLLGLALLAAGALTVPANGAVSTRSPVAAIHDDRLSGYYADVDPDIRFAQLRALGARVARVDLRWDLVATRRPDVPTAATDPAYDWAWYDRVVASSARSGVALLFTVWGTPGWAADPAVGPDSVYGEASRRPADPADFGSFATALASRYSGRGVHLWEAWNEPNLPLFLRPQFAPDGDSWKNVSIATYAGLASAFYRAVKAVDPLATVAGGVTGPAGDACPPKCAKGETGRTQPLAFITGLAAPELRPPMDAVSHHPYPISLPRPGTPKRATFVDIYNMDALRRTVDSTYLAGRPLWQTEVGFATEPVANYAKVIVSPGAQAFLLGDAYARARLDPRITLTSWYFLQDGRDWRSGLYDRQGAAKPATTAFKLPFGASRSAVRRGGVVRLLGQVRIARGVTRVRIEERVGRRWRLVRNVATQEDGSFQLVVRPTHAAAYRAGWSSPTLGRLVSVRVPVRIG